MTVRLVILFVAALLSGCASGGLRPDGPKVPLPDPPARLQIKCDRPAVTVGQDAVQALYATRSALKTCEGKRAGWQRFYKVVREKR